MGTEGMLDTSFENLTPTYILDKHICDDYR